MNKTEFFQGLGLAPPEVEPEEIVIKGIHAKRVAPTKKRRLENSAAKAASTNQENDGLAELKASITELQEEKPKTLEELAATKDRLSEVEARIKELEESQAGKLPDEEVAKAEQGEAEAERQKAEAEKPRRKVQDDPVLGLFFSED